MTIFGLTIFFILGALAGSFLSVFVLRMTKGESFVFGRSKCPRCKKTIKPYDLIPIISYIFLGGRCRGCKTKIGPFYPILEIITGLVFALFYLRFGYLWTNTNGMGVFDGVAFLVFYLLSLMILIAVAAYDYKEMIIPDKIILPSIIVAIAFLIVEKIGGLSFFAYSTTFINVSLGILIGGGIFLFLVLVSREKWVGWGDVKLGVFLGLILGFPNILVSLLFSYIIGAIVGVFLVATKIKKRKDPIQFAPLLVLGAFIALFLGKYILEWYLG